MWDQMAHVHNPRAISVKASNQLPLLNMRHQKSNSHSFHTRRLYE